MNPSLMTAWLAEVVIVSYRAVKQNSGAGGTPSLNGAKLNTPLPLPLPSTYLSTFIVYGTLGLIPGRAARAAQLVGWGFVVATLLNLWTPGKANQKAPTTATGQGVVNPAGKGTAGKVGGG